MGALAISTAGHDSEFAVTDLILENHTTLENRLNTNDNHRKGYIVEVDLEFP